MDSLLEHAADVEPLAVLSRFRRDFYACLTARADELSELADAVLCADGPVRTLAGLSLAPEHRRGHGALYDAVNHGRGRLGRLRRRWPGCRTACGGRAAGPGRRCEQLAAARRGDQPGAHVQARYLAGERVAVAAGDHRDVAGEPAVRADHRDAERILAGRELAGGQAARDAVRHRVRDAVDVRL
jgi:DDE superfamily endonuclease